MQPTPPRRRTDLRTWITSAGWWRWQSAAALAGLMMAATALVAVVTNSIDERSDVKNDEAGRLRDRRADYEAECRYRLSLPVNDIEGRQLDGMSDLLAALADDDETRARDIIDTLGTLKEDKAGLILKRAAAIETCNREALQLYPPPG